LNDRELLEGLRKGEDEAFATIFRANYPAMVGVCERMTRDRAVAEEIVQEVFLELWRRREKLTVEDSLRAYLFRSTRNRALNHLRHIKVEKQGEPFAAGPSATSPVGSANLVEEELQQALRSAVESLPDRCREIFEMSRVGGLRYVEIAETLGISVKGVEAQMGKALRLLRERLDPWLDET
jgi:RNA polymerase sigma-70 factor, ECF subfamily